MPTYEYVCTNCGRHLEIGQSFSDDPLEVCEVCSGKLRRVFHPVGVLFKGSGFYRTDAVGKEARGRSEKADKASEKQEVSKDNSKSDKKVGKQDTPAPTSSKESKTAEKSA